MATQTISGGDTTNQVSIAGQLMPKGGARAIGFNLDFVSFQQIIIDFTYAYENTQFQEVMGVFVDNSTNPQTLTIQAQQAPQELLVVPPFSQGVFPILAPIRPKFTVATDGSVVVGLIFTNIPLATAVWSVQTPGTPTTPTTFSVTTAGTAVNPWGTQHVTAGGFIYNPTSNGAAILYVDFVNSAGAASPGVNGTTVDLAAGDSIPIPTGYISVSVTADTDVTPFVAFGMGVL